MLFNSVHFLIFFPVVLLLFYMLPVRFRWVMLLIASSYFYMVWRVDYFFILVAYIIANYFCAIRISELDDGPARKRYLYAAIFFNFGILFIFKYFNFFNSVVHNSLASADVEWNVPLLNLVLPLGISFHTFQTMSYVVDVYRRDIKPERHFGIFSLFVTFFPQLVAGPIERASHLLTSLRDLRNKLNNELIISAVQQITLGFFKKLVIADRVASYVNQVYAFPSDYSGLNVAIATFFFAVQIYCDFSGYSDIALGTARLLGVKLMDNFKSPYFSQSIAEFWSRWHISLSTWFRDYLYIPLGGNRVVKWRWYYNLFITFMISGLWHGANWTFIIWGMLHGTYLVCGYLFRDLLARNGIKLEARSKGIFGLLRMSVTFVLVYFAWIFFRAKNLDDAFLVIQKICTLHTDLDKFTTGLNMFGVFSMLTSLGSIALLIVVERLMYSEKVSNNYSWKLGSTIVLCCLTLLVGVMGSMSFIYFQF